MPILTACQTVAYQALAAPQPLRYVAKIMVGLTTLKATSSLAATQLLKQRWRRQRTASLPAKLNSLLDQHQLNPTAVWLIDHPQRLATTIGWRRPKIILSTSLVTQLSTHQLEAVLLHELHHLRHYHPLILAVVEMVNTSLLILPLITELIKHLKLKFETAADQAAISYQQTPIYIKQALAILIQSPRSQARWSLAVGFQLDFVERRLAALNHQPLKTSWPWAKILSSLIVATAIGLYLTSHSLVQAELTQTNPICLPNQCVSSCLQTYLSPASTNSLPMSVPVSAMSTTDD